MPNKFLLVVVAVLMLVFMAGCGGGDATGGDSDKPAKEVVNSEREKDLEAKYHDQIKSQSVRMENAGKELGRLFKSTEVNDAWFVDLLSEAMIMENVVKEAREMEVPEKFTVAHTEYLKGIEYAGAASDSFKAVANSFNLGADEIKMLEDGAGNLTKSAEHINKFKKEIEDAF